MTAADVAAVLALNATAEGLVEPLGADRLDWLRLIAAHAVVVDLDGAPAGFVLTFFAGTAFFSSAQVYLTTVMAERRGPALSWNNSVLYLGTGAGTTVLGTTTLGEPAFAAVAVVFALCAAGFSARLAWARS